MLMTQKHGKAKTSIIASPLSLFTIWLTVLAHCLALVDALNAGQTSALRKEAEDLFYHGYEQYMQHGFPEDELRPVSCKPLTRDRHDPAHFEINDALGNYSLTLIDSLSTLAIIASSPTGTKRNKPLLHFQNGVKDFVEQYGDGSAGPRGQGLRARGFDLDSKVQVFETAIRGLGGLLSAHLFAVGELPIRGYEPPVEQVSHARKWHTNATDSVSGIKWRNGFVYDGQLLRLAYDLGNRLIPAFYTQTGMPYPRVNLKYGIPFYAKSSLNFDPEHGQCDVDQQGTSEITETCSAGAGSLVLEFTVLSRLTGDFRFEDLAKRAFWAVWDRRSEIGLVGAGIDAETGKWVDTWTGIGAGIDSFFEYAFKAHVLLSSEARPLETPLGHVKDPRTLFTTMPPEQHSSDGFLDVWETAHAAIKRHVYRGPNFQHPHYIQTDLITGAAKGFWIDSLSAYYPGLLTLAGYVEEAIETHLLSTALWARFSAIPERWNLITGGVEGGLGWWGGRPEFIESTYYLYRALGDPWYLHVGEMVLRDIKRRCWTKCGWAGIQNVLTGEKNDRMESFFLGETAKYLFLLFDPEHPLNSLDAPWVFSTEGHPLIIPKQADTAAGIEHRVDGDPRPLTCPAKPQPLPFGYSHTASRQDVYHAASLARLHLMPQRETSESHLGEYAADHPSITYADISSPSNYTYYPWTLPPNLIPPNAISSLMPMKNTFDISFPPLQHHGPPAPPLQRVKEGVLINAIGGLRFSMVQDVPVEDDGTYVDAYRIHSINNLGLGKDEKVYLTRDTGLAVLNPTDPNFTRVRDTIMLDLVIDIAQPQVETSARNATNAPSGTGLPDLDASSDNAVKSAWHALLSQLSNLFPSNDAHLPFSLSPPTLNTISSTPSGPTWFHLPAILPTGPGAAPLPDWPEPASLPTSSTTTLSLQPLQFSKIHATDTLCTSKLPNQVIKQHQILILQRGGGCSFSHKLSQIPSFVPGPDALQLVIIVSYDNELQDEGQGQLIRPLLDEAQVTPNGIARRNPIPMVMVGGGERTYQALRRASGIGVKRRYSVRTQGVPIANLIII